MVGCIEYSEEKADRGCKEVVGGRAPLKLEPSTARSRAVSFDSSTPNRSTSAQQQHTAHSTASSVSPPYPALSSRTTSSKIASRAAAPPHEGLALIPPPRPPRHSYRLGPILPKLRHRLTM